MVNKCPLSFYVVNLIFVIVDKRMYACSKCLDSVMGTSSCPYPILLLSLKKMCNFFVIPASTNTVSNSTYCWYVSKYELTRSSNPRTDSVNLIVDYCLTRQTKIGMSFVGKLHQTCLYIFIIMQIKDFTKSVGNTCLFFSKCL